MKINKQGNIQDRGFTFFGFLLVIVLIGIVAAMAMPRFSNLTKSSYFSTSSTKSDANTNTNTNTNTSANTGTNTGANSGANSGANTGSATSSP